MPAVVSEGRAPRGVVVVDSRASSLEGALAEIVDALADTAVDARAWAFVALATRHHASDPLRDGLASLTGGAPLLVIETHGLAVAPTLDEEGPRLVVVAIADEAARAQRAAFDDDGPSATARLLEGGAMGRLCLLSSTLSSDGLAQTLLPSLDEQGALVVGAHATAAESETGALFLSRGRVLVAIASARASTVDDAPSAPDARVARAELEQALHAIVGEARARVPRLALVFTSRARDAGFWGVQGYDHERVVDVLLSLTVPIVTATVDAVCASSDEGAVVLADGCVIAILVEDA